MVEEPLELENPLDENQTISFEYTNYRGETDVRSVIILGIRWGNTTWHPQDGWLLRAVDLNKREEREFALKDCNFTHTKR